MVLPEHSGTEDRMNAPLRKLSVVRRLPRGVAMSRSMVVNGRPIFCWKKLSKAQRQNVEDNSRPEFFDADHLGRVLDARNMNSRARRRER